MGIPVYFKTLIDDYNNICIPSTQKINSDYLFFDLNCLIHPCCKNETDESKMYENIFNTMVSIIELVNSKKVYISIDGPCPKPKMIQQRLRRYKSSKLNKIWDTNAITPGTTFLLQLEDYLLTMLNNTSISIKQTHLILSIKVSLKMQL